MQVLETMLDQREEGSTLGRAEWSDENTQPEITSKGLVNECTLVEYTRPFKRFERLSLDGNILFLLRHPHLNANRLDIQVNVDDGMGIA